eukprot:scaffold25307_cov109-Isochrysis_galbana.AAC.8
MQPELHVVGRRCGAEGRPGAHRGRAMQVERAAATAEHLGAVDGQFFGDGGAMERDNGLLQEGVFLSSNCERAVLHKNVVGVEIEINPIEGEATLDDEHNKLWRGDVHEHTGASGDDHRVSLDRQRATTPRAASRPQVHIRVQSGWCGRSHTDSVDGDGNKAGAWIRRVGPAVEARRALDHRIVNSRGLARNARDCHVERID